MKRSKSQSILKGLLPFGSKIDIRRQASKLTLRMNTQKNGMESMVISNQDISEANILIVDDQQANVMLLEQLLAEEGYKNVTATMIPEEICSLNRKNHYDLILLDLQMPDMDGFQVMEALKTNTDDGYLPVIVLTAQPGHKLQALKAGAKDFISKPFDLVEVKTRIRNMIEMRLSYKKLKNYNTVLEQTVRERTAELLESEARYRSLTELSSDWYWEQDENMKFSKVSGPVLEMLGIQVDSFMGESTGYEITGWNEAERSILQEKINTRQPFLDLIFSRTKADGSQQMFRVSGEPRFNQSCDFIGYRGVGVEVRVGK